MAKIRFAEVRNLKDPWESGRVQIRIYGLHDDEQNVKDEHLPWSMPMQNITSAATERIGTSPTGMLVGSRVLVTYHEDDHEEQYPIIMGTYARAGKSKSSDDNTGGFDDIDNKYGDPPLAQYGSTPIKESVNQSKQLGGNRRDPKGEPKYNNSDYKDQSSGKNPLSSSKDKFAPKLGKLPTLASVDKKELAPVLQMLQKIDGQAQSSILPQAVTNLQQIVQMGNVTGAGGISNILGGSLGNVLQNVAGQVGLGSVMSQLGGALGSAGIPGGIPGIAGIPNIIGGVPVSIPATGAINIPAATAQYTPTSPVLGGNNTTTTTTKSVPTLNAQISNITVDLLNQLAGYTPQNSTISQIATDDQNSIYLGLLYLLQKTNPDLTLETNPALNVFYNLDGTVTIDQKYIYATPPDGYFEVFSYSDTDPYPGYIRWEGPNGELAFTVRPSTYPYSKTPTEAATNAGIYAMENDLLQKVKAGLLDINALLAILGNGKAAVTSSGNQSTLGSGIDLSNILQFAQMLLGVLGGNINKAISSHISNSVLDPKVQDAVKGYTQKMALLRSKKKKGQKVTTPAPGATGNSGLVDVKTSPPALPAGVQTSINMTTQPGVSNQYITGSNIG